MSRLHVLTAAESDKALILRRGPSAWYHLIQWQTQRDAFTRGAWFKGRIYEDKCDLSPDGGLFLYFVHKEGAQDQPDVTHAWTAISRPPWLHALALWPQGTTYGGGGYFVGNRELIVSACQPEFTGNDLSGLKLVDTGPRVVRDQPDIPDADWAGYDFTGEIVFSVGDKLFRRGKKADDLIADFTGLQPDPEPPPEWARRKI